MRWPRGHRRAGVADDLEDGGALGLVGWLITGCAVTLGAPFWFDMLNKIIVVRSTVKPDEKSGTEAPKEPTK